MTPLPGLQAFGHGISRTIELCLLIVTKPAPKPLGTIKLVLKPLSGIPVVHPFILKSPSLQTKSFSSQAQEQKVNLDIGNTI
ncbi:hypothetical protein SynPROSU1_01778 [Synechococcus sp. PROS-U-1]|nr:hypothetical protein SynPROSU1_01778 [Synechococcus sp. PROS-U-1]